MSQLPPGQWLVNGFPRFGVGLGSPPPRVPAGHAVELVGLDGATTDLPVADLATLPRHSLTADFHCVSGWSAVGLHWEGVRLRDALAPLLGGTARPTFLRFEGTDGFRSIVAAEDALTDDVLLADRLDGEPLTPDHGAPVRLLSPQQYGFVSVKHLRRIELHDREPRLRYHPALRVQLVLRVVTPHRRARVWEEERHRYLPSWLARRIYRQVVPRLAPRVRP